MNHDLFERLAYSGAIVMVIHLSFHLLKRYAKATQNKFGMRKSRYFAVKRLLSAASVLVSLAALILIWNVNLNHLWVSLTGVLTLTAIAFFAIWSLVGNILAGFILFFTSPFKIEDIIEVMPDEIRGTVLAINTFYTVLVDEDQNYINIPNSMFFQKYIRVIKAGKSEQRAERRSSDAAV